MLHARTDFPMCVIRNLIDATIKKAESAFKNMASERGFLASGHDGGPARLLLLHQGIFGNGSDGGLEEDRRAGADPARRRRPDRAHRRLGPSLLQARQGL